MQTLDRQGNRRGAQMTKELFSRESTIDDAGWTLIHKIEDAFTVSHKNLVVASRLIDKYCDENYPQALLATMLGCSQARISQLQSFHRVRGLLKSAGRKPPDNEYVLRALYPFDDDEETVVRAFDEAEEEAEVERKIKGNKRKWVSNRLVGRAVRKIAPQEAKVSWGEADGLLRTLDILIGRVKKSGRSQMHKLLLEIRILLQEEL